MPAIEAMRPHQWLKNILVFLPVIAGHAFSPETLGRAVLAFLAFGLVASSVYVLNDLFDLSADRAHPRKHRRPFASGRLPIAHGTWLLSVLLLGGLVIATALGGQFVLVMLGYFTATTLYSLWLKRQIVVDICILAGLYTLRIVAGSVATGIPLSVWLLAFGMFFFFALAAVKRQAELVGARDQNKEPENGNRRGYRIEDMPLVAQMATASGYVSVLVMALYLQSPEVQAQYTWPGLLWGVCLILLYWISRMVMLAHRGRMYDDPVLFAATDRVSLLAGALIAMLVAAAALL